MRRQERERDDDRDESDEGTPFQEELAQIEALVRRAQRHLFFGWAVECDIVIGPIQAIDQATRLAGGRL